MVDRIRKQNKPACNLRFGASGAVPPQKRQCELASEYPAGTAVEAPPDAKPLGRYLPYGGDSAFFNKKFDLGKNIACELTEKLYLCTFKKY